MPGPHDSPDVLKPPLKPPLKPWVVLVAALLLPGMGQVLNNMPQRALTMVLFLVFLAMVSYHLTGEQHSWAGRHAGGIFVYGVMVMDAWRWARFRWELFLRTHADLVSPIAGPRGKEAP